MKVYLCDNCHARLVVRGDTLPQGDGHSGHFEGICQGCENANIVHGVVVLDTQDLSFLKSTEQSKEGATMENQDKEQEYIKGSRAAWASMLQKCLAELGYDSPEAQGAKWILEREAAISQLRDICESLGDNDWDENLHLADILEKHLAKYLDKLTASEALFGFVGWLTSRDEVSVFSARHEASLAAQLVNEFCKVNNLATLRDHWHENLVHPKN